MKRVKYTKAVDGVSYSVKHYTGSDGSSYRVKVDRSNNTYFIIKDNEEVFTETHSNMHNLKKAVKSYLISIGASLEVETRKPRRKDAN